MYLKHCPVYVPHTQHHIKDSISILLILHFNMIIYILTPAVSCISKILVNYWISSIIWSTFTAPHLVSPSTTQISSSNIWWVWMSTRQTGFTDKIKKLQSVAWHWCKSIGGSIIQLIILKIWVKWWDWLESVYLIQYLVTSIPVIIQRQSKNIYFNKTCKQKTWRNDFTITVTLHCSILYAKYQIMRSFQNISSIQSTVSLTWKQS